MSEASPAPDFQQMEKTMARHVLTDAERQKGHEATPRSARVRGGRAAQRALAERGTRSLPNDEERQRGGATTAEKPREPFVEAGRRGGVASGKARRQAIGAGLPDGGAR
jgi:general stress protein YciG